MSRRLTWLGLLSLISLLASCDTDGNGLRGSLSTFHDLSFSSVRARLYSSELAIEYVRENQEVALRVTVRRAEIEPGPGVEADLATQGDVTGATAGTPLPPLTAGTVRFSRFSAAADSTVRGHFDARFEAGLTEVGLTGDFDVPLTLAPDPTREIR
jgi:hypothetical protein